MAAMRRVVFQVWLHESLCLRFLASHLSYTSHARHQCQAAVKVPGSFRPAAGSEHLYSHCNFAESLVETVPKSLRHSCRSELTRQGISLALLLKTYIESTMLDRWVGHFCRPPYVAIGSGPYLHLRLEMAGVWSLRILDLHRVFPADCPH